jgi:hypothetical protein
MEMRLELVEAGLRLWMAEKGLRLRLQLDEMEEEEEEARMVERMEHKKVQVQWVKMEKGLLLGLALSFSTGRRTVMTEEMKMEKRTEMKKIIKEDTKEQQRVKQLTWKEARPQQKKEEVLVWVEEVGLSEQEQQEEKER